MPATETSAVRTAGPRRLGRATLKSALRWRKDGRGSVRLPRTIRYEATVLQLRSQSQCRRVLMASTERRALRLTMHLLIPLLHPQAQRSRV